MTGRPDNLIEVLASPSLRDDAPLLPATHRAMRHAV
jgi:hypothetical protein